MIELDKKKCVPCEGGLEPLSIDKSKSLLKMLDNDWVLGDDAKYIEKTFIRKIIMKFHH